MRRAGLIISLLILPFVFTLPAHADCVSIYGGGQTCTGGNMTLQKTVLNPDTNTFVAGLGLNDHRFSSGDTITFQLTVTNTSLGDLDNVVITDPLPQGIDFSSVNGGTFENSGGRVIFNIGTLAPGQSETRTLSVTAGAPNEFQNQGTNCITNQATATATNTPNQLASATACISTAAVATPAPMSIVTTPTPVNITTTPATGPEALPLLSLIPTGILGITLRKISKAKGGEK